MNEVTYENVKPLIVDTKQHGGFLQFVFECPATKRQVWSDNIRADDFVNPAKLAAVLAFKSLSKKFTWSNDRWQHVDA